ncbi:MAG: VanZ family protein [Anaerolineae bacterium]|nr:VanZ family protein [Anaerolineae bacterium]
MRRWGWWGAAALVAAWLLWMTLRPNETVAANLAPLTGPAAARGISPYVLISLAGNVAVFVPLGAALALALGGRVVPATLLGAALSLSIELAQLALPSRVSAVDDWLLNTLGTALGALVGWGIRWMIRPQRTQRK